MMLRTTIIFLTAMLALTQSFIVVAQNKSVATVSAVSGDVYLQQIDQTAASQMIARGTNIYAGERIKTAVNSSVTINFFDLTRVVLDADSLFVIKQFPQTMDKGDVVLELITGGARVTSGIIAKRTPERFSMLTPGGTIKSSQAQWVVQSCTAGRCDEQHETYQRCAAYVHPPTHNRQFVSVYKGSLEISGCAGKVVKEGESIIKIDEVESGLALTQDQRCDIVDQVPCFVLLNEKLGRDKFRQFLPNLTPIEGQADLIEKIQKRPHKRPPTIRPRIDRPNRR